MKGVLVIVAAGIVGAAALVYGMPAQGVERFTKFRVSANSTGLSPEFFKTIAEGPPVSVCVQTRITVKNANGKTLYSISNSEVRNPTGALVYRINDGEIRSPTGRLVYRVDKGRLKNPAGKTLYQFSEISIATAAGRRLYRFDGAVLSASTGRNLIHFSEEISVTLLFAVSIAEGLLLPSGM